MNNLHNHPTPPMHAIEQKILEALGMADCNEAYASLLEIVDNQAAETSKLELLDPARGKAKESLINLTESLASTLVGEQVKCIEQGNQNRYGLIGSWKQQLKTRMVHHLINLASTTDEIASIAPHYKKTLLIDLVPLWVKTRKEFLAHGDVPRADALVQRCIPALNSLGEWALLTWTAEEAWYDGKKALLAGDETGAFRLFKESQEHLDRPELYEILWRMQLRIGMFLQSTGRQLQAFEEYKQAIIGSEFIRMKTEAHLRPEMAKLIQPLFHGALDAAFSQSLFNECLILIELAKARNILDIRGMKEALSSLPPAPTGWLSKKAVFPGNATILPRFLADFLTGETNLESMYGLIPEKTVAIHYFLADPYLYILVISASGHLSTKRSVLARGFYQACRKALMSLDSPGKTRKDLLAYLYDVLVGSIEDAIPPETEILHILPHSNLHFLPFHAFLKPDGKGGREYLISSFDVVYSPSMSLLDIMTDSNFPSRKSGSAPSALVMGNPDMGDPALNLPGAEAEARHIATILGTEACTGKEATTETFMAKAGDVEIISLSCHGHPKIDRPLEGYLALNGPPLSVERILGLDLKAVLVSLSACYSGVEKITPGDETTGITQAFFAAGAKSVMSSLWEAPDRAARDLMGRFFLHWINGNLTRARALRLAQLEMIYSERISREYDPSDPYFWAFPVLIGKQ